ncbi:Serine/threonine-protein phosphatase 2A activator [Dissostichus eleginoides]|uniref:Serine/threonine-protein phosphatase 2A activator n=1 Tax=Dissostichus eleginoides TaxID=100907 RepID=A0AAD9F088_DISEL|nr:Serine/threonine-protein phosphatase 2A activator [Dissostichus eleginoides]
MAEAEQQSGSTPEDEASKGTDSVTFMVPKKEISMVPDMGKWKRSMAYADYIGFILALNGAVKGKKLSCEYKVSETVQKLLDLLGTLDRWINETPPVDQPSRFGNKAYRTWYSILDQEAESLVFALLPEDTSAAAAEIAVYLKESVGNAVRIDYGTGVVCVCVCVCVYVCVCVCVVVLCLNWHEAAFAAFLCCLCKVGALKVDDQLAIVFLVFNRYLEVMRKLQKTYRMEPAGSQGVWGLDDFQFLPFIWGSSQFVDHPTLEPRHFLEERVVDEQQHEYMFLECIKFINEGNRVCLHPPFSSLFRPFPHVFLMRGPGKCLEQFNQGLIRMYKAECLEKFPVIQHFKFGSLLSIQPGKP